MIEWLAVVKVRSASRRNLEVASEILTNSAVLKKVAQLKDGIVNAAVADRVPRLNGPSVYMHKYPAYKYSKRASTRQGKALSWREPLRPTPEICRWISDAGPL